MGIFPLSTSQVGVSRLYEQARLRSVKEEGDLCIGVLQKNGEEFLAFSDQEKEGFCILPEKIEARRIGYLPSLLITEFARKYFEPASPAEQAPPVIGAHEVMEEPDENSDGFALALSRRFLTSMPLDKKWQQEWIQKRGDELAAYLDKPLKPSTVLEIAIALSLGGRRDGADAIASQLRAIRSDSAEPHPLASRIRDVAWNIRIQNLLISLSAPREKADTRRLAADALGGAFSQGSVNALARLFEDPDFTVRVSAATSLASMASQGIVAIEDTESRIGKLAAGFLMKKAVQDDVLAVVALAREEVWDANMMSGLRKAIRHQNETIREMARAGVIQLVKGGEIPRSEAALLLGD